MKVENSFNCPLCNDTGWIEDTETHRFKECICVKEQKSMELLKNTGLSKEQLKTSLKTFEVYNKDTKVLKEIATNYYISFDKNKHLRNNSLGLFGESGIGKTHLLSALINNFVTNKKLKIAYMSYIDSITELKQNIINADIYKKKMKIYKECDILAIDDLFKGGCTDSDIRIMLEIINYRYSANLPIMISSELSIIDLIKIDKALGGRIKEMTKGYNCEIRGTKNNYRLKDSLRA